MTDVPTTQGPASYRYVRSRYGNKLRVVAYENKATLDNILTYVRAGGQREQTLVIDAIGDIHNALLIQFGGHNPMTVGSGQTR